MPKRPSMLRFIEAHQIDLSLVLLGTIGTGYALGIELARKFVELSYRLPETEPALYGKGWDDAYYVLFWVIAFTFLRASIMRFVLHPIIRSQRSAKSNKVLRFCEQGWLCLYYVSSWSLGMYIIYHSEYWLDTRYFWIGYPHDKMSWLFKFYYLSQVGFWMQQIFVLQVEERRKDYYEMFFHHILTNTLLILSYATNFVRIGNAMLCIMDFADIFLTSAKSLRYLRLQKTCDVMFGLFVIVWFITRHGLFFCIWYSVAIEPEQYGSVNWDPANGIYYTPAMRWVFNGLFALLQVVLLIWTSLIIKVLVKVLRGKEATDNRSDSSSSDEHEPSKKSQ